MVCLLVGKTDDNVDVLWISTGFDCDILDPVSQIMEVWLLRDVFLDKCRPTVQI